MAMQNIWDTIEKVDVRGGERDSFEVGEHLCTIKKTDIRESKNPAKPGHVFAIVEMVTDDGETRSAVFTITPDPYNYGKGEFKALVCTALGLAPAAVDKRVMDNVTGPAQSLAGRRIKVRAYNKSTKNGDILKFAFESLGESSTESGPEAPPDPEPEAVFPPAGWAPNPKAPGWFYRRVNGQVEQKTEAQLRAL